MSRQNARIRELLDPFDACRVECDGFTRIANSELIRARIKHHVYIGVATFKGEQVAPHYWIVLPSGMVIDYRLRMWVGPAAPHGVFDPKDYPDLEYRGTHTPMSTPIFLADILKSLK